MRNFLFLSTSLIMTFFVSDASLAQVKIDTKGDWTLYTTELEGKKTCYIASFPKSKTGNYSRRDEPYLLITRISDSVHEVSTSSGYKYKKGSEVKVDVDGTNYNLFTSGEVAWAYDVTEDRKIIDSMKKGNKIKIRGTSLKGTYSVDTYSLSGVTAAFSLMTSKTCR